MGLGPHLSTSRCEIAAPGPHAWQMDGSLQIFAARTWCHYSTDKELLERVQTRFTRMINGLGHSTYMERLERLHLWTLEESRNRLDLIEVLKIIKGYTKCEISNFFILDNRCKGIWGHSVKLIKTRNNRDVLKFFFSRRVTECWNQLEQHVVDASSINSFKSHLQRIRETRMGFYGSR